MELLKSTIGYGITSALGTHVATKAVESTAGIRGRIFSYAGDTAKAYLPTCLRSSISAVATAALSKLADTSDSMQAPMNKVQERQNEYVFGMKTIEEQQTYGAIFNAVNRTIIAPVVEEILYRGPQIIGGRIVEQLTGLDTFSSQMIVAAATNTMFGLAHTGGRTVGDRVNSQEFSYSFTKGTVLAVTGAISGLGTAVLGHALSNLPAGVKQLRKDLAQ